MLATIEYPKDLPCQPVPEPVDYSGYELWEAFLAEPNRERRSADWLFDNLKISVYWPNYVVQKCYRGRAHVPMLKAVLPCTILAPIEMLDHPERNRILDWARLRPLRSFGRLLTKAEIEIIREIEAKLNVRFDKKTYNFQIGQRVRFQSELYAAFLGEGMVIDVASGNRISIKVEGKLFGGKDEITVPAAELEAM